MEGGFGHVVYKSVGIRDAAANNEQSVSASSTPNSEDKSPAKKLVEVRIFRDGNWISHRVTHDNGQAYITRLDGLKAPLRQQGNILSFTTQFGTSFTIDTTAHKSSSNEPVELVYE